ncbi:MAG: lipid-A-disaccharide synthase [Candidatus Kapaibacteriota bacterium]|jgi:lipid-A-disaccharide synthase
MGKPNIFVVAGEKSGDIHTSKLLVQLKKQIPNVSFVGIGGQRMEEAGLQSIVPLDRISVVGFSEVIKNINYFRKTFEISKNILKSSNIDLVILVDFPGFNLKIAELASSLGIPVCYYIAPQIWAWGKKRIKKLEKNVDLLLVVLPFEKDFFSSYIENVEFVGHPLLDEPVFRNQILSYEERENSIAILPASRKSEIIHHHNLIIKVINSLKRELPEFVIKIPVLGSSFWESFVTEVKRRFENVVFEESSYEVLRSSKVGIIKSGTSNLESALLGLPYVMFYKTSFATYFIAKQLVQIDYISIVNLLLNGRFIPEFIQKDATAEKIVSTIKALLTDRDLYNSMQASFLKLRDLLGGSGASERAAKKIIEFFGL